MNLCGLLAALPWAKQTLQVFSPHPCSVHGYKNRGNLGGRFQCANLYAALRTMPDTPQALDAAAVGIAMSCLV